MRAAALGVAIVVLAGCAQAPSQSGGSAPVTGSPASAAPLATASPVTSGATSAPSISAGILASPIPIDSGLLDLLPASVDGLARQTDPSVDAGIAASADLAGLARSFATAIFIDPASGDFAYASVVRLQRPLSAEAYRDYRDSFDAAACSRAGGTTGTATSTIGGRTVDIGHCSGGLLTYHVTLDGPVAVSISSLGDRRLGEKVVAGLREPQPSPS